MNIITFFGFCILPKKLFILMEYYPSNNLYEIIFDDELEEHSKLNAITERNIALQLCEAVSHLHSRKNPIIHRDIKPENILINSRLLLKLCDFSLSTTVSLHPNLRTTKGHKSTKGSPSYLAPEILIDKKNATAHSDVWNCACVIFELYSKSEVWSDFNASTDFKEFIGSAKVPNLSKVPTDLSEILKKCFVKAESRPIITELKVMLDKL